MSRGYGIMTDSWDLKTIHKDPGEWRFSMKMHKAWKTMAGARKKLQPMPPSNKDNIDDFISPSPQVPKHSTPRKRQRVWHSIYASPHVLQKSVCGNTWRTFSNGTFEDLAWSQQSASSNSQSHVSQSLSARPVSTGNNVEKKLERNDSIQSKARQEAASSLVSGDADLFQEAQRHSMAKFQPETFDSASSMGQNYGTASPSKAQQAVLSSKTVLQDAPTTEKLAPNIADGAPVTKATTPKINDEKPAPSLTTSEAPPAVKEALGAHHGFPVQSTTSDPETARKSFDTPMSEPRPSARGSLRSMKTQPLNEPAKHFEVTESKFSKRQSIACVPSFLESSNAVSSPPTITESVSERRHREIKEWIEKKEWLTPTQDALVSFSPNEKAIMRRYFELRDADGSGALSAQEFMWVIDDMGRTPKEGSQDGSYLKRLLTLASEETGGEVGFENFLSMLAAYYTCVYDRIFHEQDADGSGEIAQDELSGLVKELRHAGFDIQEDLVPDLIASVDTDGNGVLDFKEFCEFMRQYRILEFGQLQTSSGWTTNQMLHLQTLFESADADQSGSLDIKEVIALLEKHPRGPSLETPEAIDRFVQYFARMDKDRSASLDFEEYLRLLRVWSNDGDNLQENKDTADDEGVLKKRTTHTMQATELVRRQSLDQNKLKQSLRTQAIEYDVEMEVLSSQWNITVEEVHAMREGFEFCDEDGSGQIDERELVPLLEIVGFPTTTMMQKNIIAECLKQCELGSDLTLAGTLKLVSIYQKALARATVQSYNVDSERARNLVPDLTGLIDGQDTGKSAADTNDANGEPKPAEPQTPEGSVPTNKLVLAFYELGCYVSREEISELLTQIEVDLNQTAISETHFEHIFRIHRGKRLLKWRRSYGFTSSELKRFRKCCESHGCDEANIELDKVLSLTDDLGVAPTDEEHRDALMRALMRVDRKGSGMISFEEFVLLLRHLENQNSRRRTQEENKAAKAAGLDPESVKQFRDAFNMLDESRSGLVQKKNIREFLKQRGVVRTVEQKKLLEQIFKQIDEKIIGKSTMELSFAQFLYVLKGLDNGGEI